MFITLFMHRVIIAEPFMKNFVIIIKVVQNQYAWYNMLKGDDAK